MVFCLNIFKNTKHTLTKMATIILNTTKRQKAFSFVRMLVFDMAGTTINEKGLVYKTLYGTMKDYGLDVSRKDIAEWHGKNKYEVLYSNVIRSDMVNKEVGIQQLYANFRRNLKTAYFEDSNIELMNPKIPVLFNKIREGNILIGLNTGYDSDIQTRIMKKLDMHEFVDDWVSSSEVERGRPSPDMINLLMYRNCIRNAVGIIKFGDTLNDIEEGINAKCRSSVGVLSGADNEEVLRTKTVNIIKDVMSIKVI